MITRKLCDAIIEDVNEIMIDVYSSFRLHRRNEIEICNGRVNLRMSAANKDLVTVQNGFNLYLFVCSPTEFWIKPSHFMYGGSDYYIERKYINDEAYMFQRSLVEDAFTSEELNRIYELYDKVQHLRKVWEL